MNIIKVNREDISANLNVQLNNSSLQGLLKDQLLSIILMYNLHKRLYGGVTCSPFQLLVGKVKLLKDDVLLTSHQCNYNYYILCSISQ